MSTQSGPSPIPAPLWMAAKTAGGAHPPGRTSDRNWRESAEGVPMTENMLDMPFPEIADQILRDTAKLARLKAESAEYTRAMKLLQPYMQDFPHRTVREALELMQRDLHGTGPIPEDEA